MRIAMLHGYFLHGTGSNIYVQNITRELVKIGHDIHLFCQEVHPDRFPWINRAVRVNDGQIEEFYQRDSESGATLVIPTLDLLPVYVMDHYPDFQQVKLFTELTSLELEEYIQRNLTNIAPFFEQGEFDLIHANHCVMMPYIAKKLSQSYQVPYVVTPHGSALVYTIKKEIRYERYAVEGLQNASYVLPGNLNFRDRLLRAFKHTLPNLQNKMRVVTLGVDTQTFRPVAREHKASVRTLLGKQISQLSGGKSRKDEADFIRLIKKMNKAAMDAVLNIGPSYSQKKPDETTPHKLNEIDLETDRVLIFVGRLIVGKGLHNFLIAIIPLLVRYPELKVVVTGAGPMREWGEWVVHAASTGRYDVLLELVRWAQDNYSADPSLWDSVNHYLSSNEVKNIESYRFDPSRVIFTGFLDHDYLAPLLALTEWACFPSLVPESFGLVMVEAAACGVIPLASYFSGFKEILDQFKEVLPESVFPWLTLPSEGPTVIPRLVEQLSILMEKTPPIASQLHEFVLRTFSWARVTTKLDQVYSDILSKEQ